MAILTHCLGNISGKVGGIVFRVKDGKTIIARAPRQQKKSYDPLRILRQNKFGTTGRIVSAINSSPILHDIWKHASYRGKNVHNKIFTQIYSRINDAGVPNIVSLMPAPGIIIKGYITPGIPDAVVETEALGIENGIYPEEEKNIMAAGIVILSEPVDASLPHIAAVRMASESRGLRIFFPQTFVVKPPDGEINKFRSYSKRKYYIHLITLDSKGNPVHYSENISHLSF
jgi:hypothetical protein